MQTVNENHVPTMSTEVRALFLKLWAGYEPHQKVTTPLYYLYAHFPRDRLGDALLWLIRNKKTGIFFVSFYYECGGSVLSLHKKLLTLLDKEKSVRVFAGRNFRQ